MAKVVIDSEICKSCGLCVNACPLKLLHLSETRNSKGGRSAEQGDAGNAPAAPCAPPCAPTPRSKSTRRRKRWLREN